jgi:hypothetical protein
MRYDAFMSYSHAADGKLAPRVQAGLHRLAKPLFKLRALHVFRDATDLSASPGVWSSIKAELDQAEYFILMASPEAARSQWVRNELEHWLSQSAMATQGKAASNLLLVLTDGEIVWDAEAGDFDWARSSAMPDLLHAKFSEEPLFVDMRAMRAKEDLSLQNAEFRSKLAELAAPLHHCTKAELISEDVRALKRVRRLAWSGSALLALLAAAASIAAYVAVQQQQTSRSRELAAQATAQLEVDPEHSLRFALDAVQVDRTPEATASLREALIRSTLRAVLAAKQQTIDQARFSPDGLFVITGSHGVQASRELHIWKAESGVRLCVIRKASSFKFSNDRRSLFTQDGAGMHSRLASNSPALTNRCGPLRTRVPCLTPMSISIQMTEHNSSSCLRVRARRRFAL